MSPFAAQPFRALFDDANQVAREVRHALEVADAKVRAGVTRVEKPAARDR
jgi:hypothetical protein